MKTFWRILKYIKPYTAKFVLHMLTMIIAVTLLALTISFLDSILKLLFSGDSVSTITSLQNSQFAFLTKLNNYLIDSLQEQSKTKALSVALTFIVGIFILSNLIRYISQLLMNSIRTKVIQNIRSDMFQKTQKLHIAHFEGERKGDIMSRFTADLLNIEQSIITTLESLVRDPYTIIIFIVLMISASPSLTLYIFILIPTMAIMVTFIGKSLKKNSLKSQEKLGWLSTVIDEFTSGVRVIKAFNAEEYMRSVFGKHNNDYRKQSKKVLNKSRAVPIISETLGIITVGVFLYFSGRLVFEGKLQHTLIMIFVIYFQQITQPAKKLSMVYTNIMKGVPSGERVFELIDQEILIKDSKNPISVNTFNSSIKLDNISFSYTAKPVLKNINIEIEKGKIIALVGQSGSGKTTMAELILRFYDVKSGQILIDGNDIREIKLFDLRNLMAVVNQEAILFNDTFFNNIAFGIKNAKEEDVIAAAKAANAHDFIMETENGYQTNIGERGGLLSGGQKQRISIARAIMKNPPILILDEATSALDTESEKIVQDAMYKLMENRTSIVIAHRLSTIQKADTIHVMDKGQIIESGTHADLITKNGVYKKLYELQQLES
ncbi:MAG: ABC transporter ATP-binding protein [Bacteroidetes bacterium]|nr:ABC transporter ATP-binding protein [Bacteroidota bacterium]MBT5528640.1 ABC transporter ATP-binding protein [Cytophagia bacterium]MBT3422318.1 ABC transporter ATP-binding protein [Bacteroidota bacterium]MBT3800203.1 ABC transporter ATP-binding protein [Bacteroidota bacterium]MBT3934270.1 ABC transporter ATP-binding protein [Bacteroidota bacterium]